MNTFCRLSSVVCVLLFVLTGCAIPKSDKPAATPADQEMTISDPNSSDARLVEQLRALRLENERLRTASNSSGPQGNLAQPVSLVPGANAGSPSATIVSDGASITRYDPLVSPAIPSRTVMLPGEKRAFVSFEGIGGWAICQGTQGAWGPVNLNGKLVPALRSELAGCIVATDCPTWDPDGICRKELTIIWLERSNPSHVVNRRTVMVEMQRCSQCKSIGGACYQRGPRQVCAGG